MNMQIVIHCFHVLHGDHLVKSEVDIQLSDINLI